jgi:hypothetical protein
MYPLSALFSFDVSTTGKQWQKKKKESFGEMMDFSNFIT